MSSFLKLALSDIKSIGSIHPSSKYLVNDCLRQIDFSKELLILEFGTGDGCITKELAKRISAKSELYSLETNPQLFLQAKKRFSYYPNVDVVKHSAFEFDVLLHNKGVQSVDVIVSSIPIALFNDADVCSLIRKAKRCLNPGGQFIQYQYSLGKYSFLKKVFNKVELDFTIRNLPPAFTYICS